MSRYLIRRIEENPAITLHVRTHITMLEGSDRLERVGWRNVGNPDVQMREIGSVFLMTGAVPNTAWLQGCVKMDDKGFVCTGADLLDCSRLDWNAEEIVHGLDVGRYTYKQLTKDLCIVPHDEIGERVPPEWNSLEAYTPGVTKNAWFGRS